MSASKPVLDVALIQMQSSQNVQENLAQAILFLEQAIARNARLVVFPENFLCLGVENYQAYSLAFEQAVQTFCNMAAQHKVHLLLGSIPFPADERRCYSRSLLVNTEGTIVAHYDKIHLFDVCVADNQGQYLESTHFKAGSDPKTVLIGSRVLGLSICYDLRFPELYQSLVVKGAQMIAVPSAFTYQTGEAHWELLLRARAIETQTFILAANQCGSHKIKATGKIRSTWGHSMIIDPWGKILAKLDNLPGICMAALDFAYLESVRNAMKLSEHKRLISSTI